MPRRKTTRAKPVTPKDLAGVTVADEMSENEREEQLRIFLKDFDVKVKKTQREFATQQSKRSLQITRIFSGFLASIPTTIQDMTIKEFAAYGTFEAAERGDKGDAVGMVLKQIERGLGDGLVDEPILEEGSSDEDGQQKLPQQSAQRTSKRKPKPPPSTTTTRKSCRTAKSRFTTPANRGVGMFTGATPMITPRFDPTSSIPVGSTRSARPGEISWSLAGSPLTMTEKRAKLSKHDLNRVREDLSKIVGRDAIEKLSPGRIEHLMQVASSHL